MPNAVLFLDPHEVTAPATLDSVLVNRGDKNLSYGLAYQFEYWNGEQWKDSGIDTGVFTEIAFPLGPGEIGDPHPVKIPAGIYSGFYRVTKNVTEDEPGSNFTLNALFQVR
ncbi:MAG: immunoglobulin-like domain-containing protein [Pseudonocardiaceae bacterium]